MKEHFAVAFLWQGLRISVPYVLASLGGTVCERSGVHAQIDLPSLPVHPDAERCFGEEAAALALTGGEDYELACAGSEAQRALHAWHSARQMFLEWKTKLNEAAYPVVDALEGLCERRRQLDQQARLHLWLHNWLWIHFPLSAALIVLLFWHVYASILYW